MNSSYASVTMCRPCWDAREPDRVPVRMKDDDEQVCWYCGGPTRDGIYVREKVTARQNTPN